jgi:hypothetical protein
MGGEVLAANAVFATSEATKQYVLSFRSGNDEENKKGGI